MLFVNLAQVGLLLEICVQFLRSPVRQDAEYSSDLCALHQKQKRGEEDPSNPAEEDGAR